MSRRKAKEAEHAKRMKQDQFMARQYVGGGGESEFHLSYEGMAFDAGLDYLDYVQRWDDGSEEVDEDRLLRDATATLESPELDTSTRIPLGFIEVRCNKCSHRVDVWSLVRPDSNSHADASSRYAAGYRIHIGESPKWDQTISYGCRRCGRSGLTLSRRRVEEFFTAAEDAVPIGIVPTTIPRQVVRL